VSLYIGSSVALLLVLVVLASAGVAISRGVVQQCVAMLACAWHVGKQRYQPGGVQGSSISSVRDMHKVQVVCRQ
jgi:hypothetical protein